MSVKQDNKVLALVDKTIKDFGVEMPFCFGTRDPGDSLCSLVDIKCEHSNSCAALIKKMVKEPDLEEMVFKRYMECGLEEGDYEKEGLTEEIERVKKMLSEKRATKKPGKSVKKKVETKTEDFEDLDIDGLSGDTPATMEEFEESSVEVGSSDVEGFEDFDSEKKVENKMPYPVIDDLDEDGEAEAEAEEITGDEDNNLDIEGFEEPNPDSEKKTVPKEKPSAVEPEKKIVPKEKPSAVEPESKSEKIIDKPKITLSSVPQFVTLDAFLIGEDGQEVPTKIKFPISNPVGAVNIGIPEKKGSEEIIKDFISGMDSGHVFSLDTFISGAELEGVTLKVGGAKNVLSRYSKKHGSFSVNKENWTYAIS